jgi:hypothetical protein
MRAILFPWENQKNVPGQLRISLSGSENAKVWDPDGETQTGRFFWMASPLL